MFVKIVSKTFQNGETRHYASVVENRKVNGKVVQTTRVCLGAVREDQIPYLKAAYMNPDDPKRPILVYHRQSGS